MAFRSGVFYSQGNITSNLDLKTFEVSTDAHGVIDERVNDWLPTIEVPFAGLWNAAGIAALWGFYANLGAGVSIFTGTDTPLVLTSADTTHTLQAAACTKLPDIYLSAKRTMLGSGTFVGIPTQGNTWATTGAVYTTGVGAAISDSTFDPTQIVTQPYSASLGSVAGFTSFNTEDGWTISFDLKTQPRPIDPTGTIDYRFVSIGIMAKCVPLQTTEAQILAALGMQTSGAVRGRSLAAGGASLTVTGMSNSVNVLTIPNCAIKGAGYRFGSQVLRNGEVGFVGTRTFTSGVQNALYTLAAS